MPTTDQIVPDGGSDNPEGGPDNVARREALLKVIKTTAYTVPVATLLLVSSKEAKAGLPVS